MEEYYNNYKPDFQVTLPHKKYCNYYNLPLLYSNRETLRRKLSLSNVKKLYLERKYDELEIILKDTIMNMSNEKTYNDTVTLKVQIQIEVLLESLWKQEKYEVRFCFCSILIILFELINPLFLGVFALDREMFKIFAR